MTTLAASANLRQRPGPANPAQLIGELDPNEPIQPGRRASAARSTGERGRANRARPTSGPGPAHTRPN
ncbi:hypothetical protein DMP23_40790 [Amycolatopsis sp. A1MSW2902]|uniref:hypothetical protein n=1 Tax=Amycolatopsis sp. A1MSW2902 TaxID=687413 RepID=UPI00307E5E01